MKIIENRIEKNFMKTCTRHTLAMGIVLAIVLTVLWFCIGNAANGTTTAAAPVLTGTGTDVLNIADPDFDHGTLANVNPDAPESEVPDKSSLARELRQTAPQL